MTITNANVLSPVRLAMLRRGYQKLVHPQKFIQTIQLTDGSLIRMPSISGERQFVKLGVDSLMHPSWNLQVRKAMMSSEQGGQISKFKEKFGGQMMELDGDGGLEEFSKLVGVTEELKIGEVKSVNKKTTAAGKKKK